VMEYYCGYCRKVTQEPICSCGKEALPVQPQTVLLIDKRPLYTPAPPQTSASSQTSNTRWGPVNAAKRRRGDSPFDSKAEEDYYREVLEPRVRSGDLRTVRPHGVKLRLADRTWYTVDFYAESNAGHIELHEVKGTMGDGLDAKGAVKRKVAVERYPAYRWFLATRRRKKDGGGFRIESLS